MRVYIELHLRMRNLITAKNQLRDNGIDAEINQIFDNVSALLLRIDSVVWIINGEWRISVFVQTHRLIWSLKCEKCLLLFLSFARYQHRLNERFVSFSAFWWHEEWMNHPVQADNYVCHQAWIERTHKARKWMASFFGVWLAHLKRKYAWS